MQLKNYFDIFDKYLKKVVLTYKHCAILFEGKKIINIAYNKYSRKGLYMQHSFHAETEVLKIIPKNISKKKIKNYRLVVVRINNNTNNLMMSKPCSTCTNIISRYKIPVCYYSH